MIIDTVGSASVVSLSCAGDGRQHLGPPRLEKANRLRVASWSKMVNLVSDHFWPTILFLFCVTTELMPEKKFKNRRVGETGRIELQSDRRHYHRCTNGKNSSNKCIKRACRFQELVAEPPVNLLCLGLADEVAGDSKRARICDPSTRVESASASRDRSVQSSSLSQLSSCTNR